ncbi:hypothetical protein JOQ06_027270, partial [Pogonophryne albipinna]
REKAVKINKSCKLARISGGDKRVATAAGGVAERQSSPATVCEASVSLKYQKLKGGLTCLGGSWDICPGYRMGHPGSLVTVNTPSSTVKSDIKKEI